MKTPKMIAADVPALGRMYYLIDDQYDFILEVKEFLEWKAATNRGKVLALPTGCATR